jgi:FkbM family methyltransferase
MNFLKILDLELDKDGLYASDQKNSNDLHGPLYVVGKNEQSKELISRFNVVGVIDDYSEASTDWLGVPVVKSGEFDRDAVVINCVSSISPVDVKRNLQAKGHRHVLNLSDLIFGREPFLSLPWFVKEERLEIREHCDWYQTLFAKLADDESRRTLIDITRFRLTANPEHMTGYTVRLSDQYFEDFMCYDQEVFVDAGGFDGDTTEEFITRYPNYRGVFLFEPSSKNMLAAKKRLSGRGAIAFKEMGLSDVRETLLFDSDSGSASSVVESGSTAVIAVTLDEELGGEAITFIKMDLEGWEFKALRGAEMIIRQRKPKLAIAVYHSAGDFRKIPQYLLSLQPSYQIYLRHYTQGWSETVMYFR